MSLRLRTARLMQADEGAALTGLSRTAWIEQAIQTAHANLSASPEPPVRSQRPPAAAPKAGRRTMDLLVNERTGKRADVQPIPKAKGW